jgi:hypothetical protein
MTEMIFQGFVKTPRAEQLALVLLGRPVGTDRTTAALAVYRDNSRPTFVAGEFRALVDQIPSLSASIPDLRLYVRVPGRPPRQPR